MNDDERTRRDVAVTRHRAAIAQSLGLADIEMPALVHLAEHGALAPSAIASLLDLSSIPLARPDARLERSLPEHRRILTAVARADPDAAREALRDHLLTVEAYLREYAGPRDGRG